MPRPIWARGVPLSAAALPDASFLQGIGSRALATGAAPGIALAVAHKGRIVYEGGFGFADVAANDPVTANTRFAIGSLTKQLTAAAIVLLVRERKISLSDDLSNYVPSLPGSGQITLRMLLDQNSGLHNYPRLSEHAWPTQGAIPLASILAILSTDKLDFSPGTKWEYSNANYAALAAVVEKVSGVPFGTFLRSQIFEPLHMTASDFGYAAQQSGAVAIGYNNGKSETPPLSLDLYSGAGGLVSSVHDMALWDLALTSGTFPSPSYLAQVWRDGTSAGPSTQRYTMGWVLATVAGHREFWHNGLTPGTGGYCYNAIFPDDGLAVAILTNGFAANGLPERMTQEVAAAYGIGTPPQPTTVPTVAPDDVPAIDRLVRAFWNQLAMGNLDRSKLTSEFSTALTPQFLAQVRQSVVLLGQLKSFIFAGKSTANDLATYRYTLIFANGAEHEWDVSITPGGKIAGSRLVH
ncbi:MAG: serine hydrolase domain-containing protein [Candidatus Cybelea sp.]